MKHTTLNTKENDRKENYLGLDFGKSKIGISIAPDGIIATGFSILPNDKNFFGELGKIISSQDVGTIIVGLPLSMEGGFSASTRTVTKFISEVQKKFPAKKIFTYDERLTSREAQKNLPKRTPDDAESARIILQGFLDKQKNTKRNIL